MEEHYYLKDLKVSISVRSLPQFPKLIAKYAFHDTLVSFPMILLIINLESALAELPQLIRM